MVAVPQPAFNIGDIVRVKDGYGGALDRSMFWEIMAVHISDTLGKSFKISYRMKPADPKIFGSTGFLEEALIKVDKETNNTMETKMEQKFNDGDMVRFVNDPSFVRTVGLAKPDPLGRITLIAENGEYLIYDQDYYELVPADPTEEIIKAAYAYEEAFGGRMPVTQEGMAIIEAVINHRKANEEGND